MARKSGIMHLRDLGPPGTPLRDLHRVLVLALHPDIEGLQSALQEPACERIRRLAPNHHLPPDLVNERLVPAHHAGEDVVVAVQVFRGRMDDDVYAVLDGAKVDWARERRVDDEGDALRVRQILERAELEHTTRRIDWRLEKDHSRRLLESFPPRPRLERIHEGHLDPHSREVFGEELARSTIDPRARDEMIAGTKECQHRARGCAHPAGQHQRRFRSFQQGQAFLNPLGVWSVAVTGIEEAFTRSGLLGKVDRLNEWGCDARARGRWCRAAVNRRCRQSQLACHFCHGFSYPRLRVLRPASKSCLTTRTISAGAMPRISRATTLPGLTASSTSNTASS